MNKLAAIVLFCAASLSAWAAPRMNVVFILADDLGVMDIGAYNPRTFYETPNIDALARNSMRFTQGYAACPVCSPTRASIMTGKYPARTGITDFIGGARRGKMLPAPNQDHLSLEETTIAERFRDAGYDTFFAGKWHLGTERYNPNHHGFTEPLSGKGQFYYPGVLPVPDPKDDPKTTDRIANEAVRFIEQHKDKPFYAYLPFLAVHTPIGARADLVEKYKKKAASAPTDDWGQERVRKVRLVQNQPVYAAMLEQMDAAVGRVIEALNRTGIADRTVICFMSDNGGLSTSEGHPTSNLPLRAGKGWPYEGGIREPWIIRAPGITKPGSTCDTAVSSPDFYPTLLELAGLALDPNQHKDGTSLVPLLKGGSIQRPPLFWHYPHYGNQGGAPCGAIRDGDWKLIEWFEDGSLELYNIPRDIGEKTNLAAAQPEKVKELHAKLIAWRKEVGAAMPTGNPNPIDPESPNAQPKNENKAAKKNAKKGKK